MPSRLLGLDVKNFRGLKSVSIGPLGPVSVLVGPNASGKSNLLDVIQFLGDSVRMDLGPALARHGGWGRVRFRDGGSDPIAITVRALVTSNANEGAPDEYKLSFRELVTKHRLLTRREDFTFKRTRGRGRRITITGRKVEIATSGGKARSFTLETQSLGLSTLPRLGPDEGGNEVQKLAAVFETFRVFDINVAAARNSFSPRRGDVLAPDASNLPQFLAYLSTGYEERFDALQRDARAMAPGLDRLEFEEVGGPAAGVALRLREHGLKTGTYLREASFGTVRALALLAMLYDPNPPDLTCVEELDHGLHPHVFDRLVELVRQASEQTQFLIATHSPALVNRLRPEELIVCERDPKTGASRIPAIDSSEVAEMERQAIGRLGLGELWFSGSLGGVP
jgi:predicted ATPase